MTRLSTLVGGATEVEYLSGVLYFARNQQVGTGASTINLDYLIPFNVRKAVTVDKVAWYRDNTSAGNAYVGIYNSAGTLLTDCAIDSDTTVGWHLVDTTNVLLLPGRVYYLLSNVSVDIAGTITMGAGTEPAATGLFGLNVALGGSGTGMPNAYSKARTNAAPLSSLVMSGWSSPNIAIPMGWVAA